jgi:uncharacterized membrane protein HdeD (DUF308 family)
MNPVLRNILAVIAGLVVGSVVNMILVTLGPSVVPPPDGADVTSMEGLRESMHLFQPKHFIMPFLAHALGTLAGAVVCALIAVKHKMVLALVVGLFFLIGGIINVFSLPAPAWFSIADLLLAYIPMAWIGGKLAGGSLKEQAG